MSAPLPPVLTPDARCGYVCVLGASNVGKSTLVNRIVGAKVAIVSAKVQTTRARICAIVMEGATQIVFVDTPGIFAPKRRLDRAMVDAAWAGLEGADEVLLVVDAGRKIDDDTRQVIESLQKLKRRACLVINKIDRVAREELLSLTANLNDIGNFSDTFLVSALTGDGVADLRRALAARLPFGAWLFPPDQLSDVPERMLAAEITREKIFAKLHDELPYASTVETESWQERTDGSVRIEQIIYVSKSSQKPIVIGEGGRTIKSIGADSRQELEKIFSRRVHLFLFVKVREKWQDDPQRFREMGLDFGKK